MCVDLDGTLIAGDLFWESLLRLVVEQPWLLRRLPLWALRGRAHFKRQVAQNVALAVDRLPYRAEVVDRLRVAHGNGDRLVLTTGSDELYAQQVVAHLGLFSGLFASDGAINLTGGIKAARLQQEFGRGKFHYFGNDWADIPVWRAAGAATVVAAPARLVRHVRNELNPGAATLGTEPRRAHAVLRALRLHQWAKNLLIFVPLALSHRLFDLELIVRSVVAFLAFGLCASSIYIVNDLFDIQSDRLHPRKKRRPFAAGELSIPFGIVLTAVLFATGAALAVFGTSAAFVLVLLVYCLASVAYTVRLKREPVLDVFVLASLYVLRVIGGGATTGIEISNWLLGFALFLFLSLAFVKRYTEAVSQNGEMPGRGYSGSDYSWMLSIGTSAGYMSVVILALYVNSTDVAVLYANPRLIWLICPILLLWITRLWFRAGRQQIHDDPVLEALKDPASYACALAAAVILFAAL